MPRYLRKSPRALGLAVRARRNGFGITQAALAERAGVSRRWLITLEQGTSGTAEMGKILDTLQALGLEITLNPQTRRTTQNKQAQAALAAIQKVRRSQ